MNFYSLIKKLVHMGPGEISGRVLAGLRVKRLQWTHRTSGKLAKRYAIPVNDVIARSVSLIPGIATSELARLESESSQDFQSMCDAARRRAQRIVAGEYELLGKSVSITPDLNWHADSSTGYVWPDDFFSQVSYHKIPEQVDFKNIWELGRQQYVVELSRSWLLGGDLAHGTLARDMILSWIESNPFCKGIHWTSGLEVAMRAISWIWTLANLSEFSGWKEGERERIVESLGLHAHYLENNFSYYSSPYNHVIGEATGLAWIASVLRGTSHATRWQRLANRVLTKFGPQQFYADGFCVEQAMGYHYYTLGFLVLAQLVAKNIGDTELQLKELICHALRAGLAFRQPDGCWPAIGDVDSAQSIPVARTNYWDFSSLHNLAAAAFEDPTIACQSISKINGLETQSELEAYSVTCTYGTRMLHERPTEADHSNQAEARIGCSPAAFGDDLYWLLGCDGIEKRQELLPVKRDATTLSSAGYYVAGDDRDHVLFDAGPISAGLFRDATPSVAHGHADTLQVLYHFNGRAVLCDSGMPNYAGNPTRAAYFRSPQAHNTVTLEGAELVRSAGVLAWSNEVQTPTLQTPKLEASNVPSPWMASGEIQWPTCRITRHLLAMPGEGLWIADWLQSDEPQVATWCWQFPLDIEPKLRSSEKRIEVIGQGVTLQAIGTKHLHGGQLISSDPLETAGWISPGYGVLQPAHRLSYQSKVDGNLLVLTCIGDSKRQIGFEAEGLSVSLAPADATFRWQRYKTGGTGMWLLETDS